MNFNAIRERVPVTSHDQDVDDEDGSDSTDHPTADLITQERTVRERFTPNSGWGWIATFGAAIILTTLLLWAAPLIPPWVFSLPAMIVYVSLVVIVAVWLHTRKTMLEYWSQYDLFVEKNGSTARTVIGEIDGNAGEDKLFKRLQSVGAYGLSPTFEAVDDVFSTERPLMSKIDRRDKDGSWDAARTRLDHAHEAEDTASDGVFGTTVVVSTSAVKKTANAPGHDRKTMPPNVVDTDAVKRIMSRDETLRQDVIPSYEERLQTRNERLSKVIEDSLEQPVYTQDEVMTLLEQMQQARTQQQPAGGAGVAPEPAPATEDVDEQVEEDMEDYND